MSKHQYLNQLSEALLPYDAKIRSEIMSDYEEHFAIGYSEGKQDDEIIASLGDISELLSFLGEPGQIKQEQPLKEQESKIATDAPRKVVLHGYTADIKIKTSKDGKIKADYVNHGSTREQLLYVFTGQQEGDTFVLRLDQKEKWTSFFGRLGNYTPAMDITLEVPADLQSLAVKSLSGDIDVENIKIDELSIRSASGDISIEHSNCNIVDIETASGDVSAKYLISSIHAKTASGDIDVSYHEGEFVRISTASGDVDYTGRCERFDGNSASGDFDIRLEQDCNVKCNVVSGEVDIRLPEHTDGISSLQFNSLSGELTCKHPTHQTKTSNHHFNSGRPGTSISIRSVSGDATII